MKSDNESNPLWKTITTSALLSICSASLGFGASQLTLKDRLSTHEADLRVVEIQAANVKADVDAWRTSLTSLLEKVIDGQNRVIEQNTQVIAVMNAQRGK